jgi:ATP-dependent helicase/nuclease subunit A
MRAAAERGRLMHALFERLPQLLSKTRATAADRWLARSAGVSDAATRADLKNAILAVIDRPDCAHLFGADGFAEVPVAGVVAGVVISGTIDRLIVGADTVDIVDFKTGRRVPSDADAVPDAYKRQMAAYAAVLRGVFPAHEVRVALLYTSGPKLIPLTATDLDAHKPGLQAAQQVLPSPTG